LLNADTLTEVEVVAHNKGTNNVDRGHVFREERESSIACTQVKHSLNSKRRFKINTYRTIQSCFKARCNCHVHSWLQYWVWI